MANEIRVSYDALVGVIRHALAAERVPQEVRDAEALIMAEADLVGVPSHGINMLPGLLAAIREGRVNADPKPRLLRDQAATCLLDGDRGPGRYVSALGMQHATERAGRYGLGLCVARSVSHWGRGHAYAYRAARAGMIGLCTTNAIPNMSAYGSTRHVLGNNPMAIGVPRGDGRDPVVLDMAMSQAAVGKIATYLREGKRVPPGWGLDASGQPTDDPAAILSSGLILPMGQHKGAGLALMLELLTGALSGGLLSHEIARVDPTGADPEGSKFLLAIDPAAFGDLPHFTQRVEDLLSYLTSEFGPDERPFYPGQRGWLARDQNLAEGIPIHPQVVERLMASGIRLPVG